MEELYKEENLDQGINQDDDAHQEDFGTLTNIEACYVEVNMTEVIHTPIPWFLDSGASHHVLGEREVFMSMKESSGTTITTARGQSHHVTTVGNIAIKLPSGIIQKIENVLYSLGIVKKLLSVGFLASKGLSLEFKER